MNNLFLFETDRLGLRTFLPSDAEAMYLLNENPNVLKYTGDVSFETVDQAHDFIESYNAYRDWGFGRWAVVRKEDQKFIGWNGLKINEEDLVDIGFRFFEEEWNKGYASESSKAVLKYGFEDLNLNEIVGRAMSENEASVKVLRKLGMTFWKSGDCHGLHNALYYRMSKNDYEVRKDK